VIYSFLATTNNTKPTPQVQLLKKCGLQEGNNDDPEVLIEVVLSLVHDEENIDTPKILDVIFIFLRRVQDNNGL
jgi:hypothetical protein